jgi:YidC/Oxa1 family membrane protein insertase
VELWDNLRSTFRRGNGTKTAATKS